MTEKVRLWTKALIAAFVTGCSSAALSAVGISGAEAVGVTVTQLNLKQLAIMTVAGGVVGIFAYLKQSPVPPE